MEISPRRLVRKDEVVEGIREIPASAGMTFEKDNLNGSSMLRSGLQRKSFCEARTKDCSGKPVKTPYKKTILLRLKPAYRSPRARASR